MEIVFFWIMFSIAAAIFANRYNRNGLVWFLVAFVASPLIAVVFLLALGARAPEHAAQEAR